MIAGGVRGDPTARVVVRQRLHRVGRAAVLERADALQVLRLDEHVRADPLVERMRDQDRRAVYERRDPSGRGDDAIPVEVERGQYPAGSARSRYT